MPRTESNNISCPWAIWRFDSDVQDAQTRQKRMETLGFFCETLSRVKTGPSSPISDCDLPHWTVQVGTCGILRC